MADESVRRAYVGIEEALQFAHKQLTTIDEELRVEIKDIIQTIVLKLISRMARKSEAFNQLFTSIFWGGSCYENLKITTPSEFDVDILMKFPEVTKPVLVEDNISGYVNLQLTNFQNLQFEDLPLFQTIQKFVDKNNFVLTYKLKEFFTNIFGEVYKQDNVFLVEDEEYKIKPYYSGPALTLKIKGTRLPVSVDLVPCILLDGRHWPGKTFRSNPYEKPDDFFLVPKCPKKVDSVICWRLSFQKQEKKIINNRKWMKPTIRLFKRLRDCLEHNVSSYALKTLFLWELEKGNPNLDKNVPELWTGTWSYCFVHMLEVYVTCLRNRNIPYFWNKQLNLLDELTEDTIDVHRKEMESVLRNIKENPNIATALNYFLVDEEEQEAWFNFGQMLVAHMVQISLSSNN